MSPSAWQGEAPGRPSTGRRVTHLTDQKYNPAVNTKWVSELVGLNFLAVADVVIDIRQESQLTGTRVSIPLYQQVVKFHDLLPAATSGLIDRACDLRLKAVQLLQDKEVISDVTVENASHRWETVIHLLLDERRFWAVAEAVDREAQRRAGAADGREASGSDSDSAAPSRQELVGLSAPQVVTLRWLFAHVPAKLWLSAVAVVISAFLLGVRSSPFSFFRTMVGLKAPQEVHQVSAGSLSAVPDDLRVKVGGRQEDGPLQVSVRVASTGGDVVLSRVAVVVGYELQEHSFVGDTEKPEPRLLSVAPDRVVVKPDTDAWVKLEFDRLSLIPRANMFSYLRGASTSSVGHVDVRLKYASAGRDQTLDIRIPIVVGL